MKESILVYIIVAAVLNEGLGILRSLRKKRENRPLFDPGVIVFLCCLPLPSDAVLEPHFREKHFLSSLSTGQTAAFTTRWATASSCT